MKCSEINSYNCVSLKECETLEMNTFKYLQNLRLFIHKTYVFKLYISSIFNFRFNPKYFPPFLLMLINKRYLRWPRFVLRKGEPLAGQ